MGVFRLDILYLYKQGEQMKITKIFQLFVLFASLYFPVIAATHQGGAEVEILVPKGPIHLFTITHKEEHTILSIEYYNDGSSKISGTLSSIDPKLSSIIEGMHRLALQKIDDDGIKLTTARRYGGTSLPSTTLINAPDTTDCTQKDKSCCGCWSRFFKFICCCR